MKRTASRRGKQQSGSDQNRIQWQANSSRLRIEMDSVFQKVFQDSQKKLKAHINQYLTESVQITSAPNTKHHQNPPCAGFVVSGLLETHRRMDLRIFPARRRALGELVLTK
jgi:hypothetical protein